jgi:hypothetical protein
MDDSDDEELDSRSLHVSNLNKSGISNLDLSAISNDPEDEHEFPEDIDELEPDLEASAFESPEDTMIDTSSQNATDDESFRTTSGFPQSQSNISDMSSPNLSDLNSSEDTTKHDSSFDGGKKRRKSRKHTKTKKSNKSKKLKKNRLTKKSKKTKTKRRRSAKKRLRGGFIGDNGRDMESYGGTNPYSTDRDSDSRF